MRPIAGMIFALFLASCGPSVPPPVVGCNGQSRSRCVSQVSVGNRFACAALGDQTVWCWGRNDERQLGYESSDLCPERLANGQTRSVACHMFPQQVGGATGVTVVRTGGAHACGLNANGAVICWGGNTTGQLGNGATLPSTVPVAVGALTEVTSLATGLRHSCAVSQGNVWCWGANDRGQLGVEATSATCMLDGQSVSCAKTPVRVASVRAAVEVVAGEVHSCARTMNGQVFCWGSNVDGELGAGPASAMARTVAEPVRADTVTLSGVQSLVAGGHHTCAQRSDGAVLCWGRNDRGQLGVPVPAPPFAPCANACVSGPVAVEGFEGTLITEMPDAGATQDASVRDGAMSADAMSADAMTPRMDASASTNADASTDASAESGADVSASVDVEEPANPQAVSLSAGGSMGCVLLDDQTVRCWGANRNGELGDGQLNEGGPRLVRVIASPGSAATNPLLGVRAVSSGGGTSCAVLQDRSVRCWGSNEAGSLGIGALGEQRGPVAVTW
ncbi:MAG: hypothetical protein Q8Q09_00175 [Deltaproteobacteria bacterium]|nr:hypothetical protein [Deltaproteobacteria bacterium]